MSLENFIDKSKDTKKNGFTRKKPTSDKGTPSGVNLVDYSQIILSTIMATYKPNDELDLNLIRHLVLNTIRSNVLKNKKHYPHVILCIDNGKGGYWRKKKAWYYKFKRSEQRDDSKWDFDVIFDAMATIKQELIDNLPYVVMDIPGAEADDHIGVLSRYFGAKQVNILVTSADGDFTQLHDIPTLKQWSPIQKKWVKPKHGSAKADLMFKCFKGDKKDGIASYKAKNSHYADDAGRAPSIMAKELEQLMTAKESELPMILNEEQFARYKENRELLDLNMIPEELQNSIRQHYIDYKVAPRNRIYPYFVKNKLTRLMTAVSEF